ncbi:hypothetical protein BEWA_020060 [Theileria equi strain WA]|uniref:Nas2 N-terminal domain-containing protein n=1 Tax=Theileria equi strain WA TaxID=1537102 RepID=L0AUC7_THEEQ|nr:hypothetical protein BEWA_020060 [Theileria equi strain WA]AFZ79160.1 hypothetical protein BEWA_020060 [Theileria equi strain WA]|eukprot:XP_004828826.1 hypothetical protein BEWA_020060 [Theileria equi strain WA]
MENILALDKKRRDIEIEIEALIDFLNSDECKNVGLNKPLVDEEQFPLSGIDIYAIREARGRVACLKNDYDQMTLEIEKGLHELHSKHRKN